MGVIGRSKGWCIWLFVMGRVDVYKSFHGLAVRVLFLAKAARSVLFLLVTLKVIIFLIATL